MDPQKHSQGELPEKQGMKSMTNVKIKQIALGYQKQRVVTKINKEELKGTNNFSN